MDRYQRVEKPWTETVISENEIRITAKGLIRNYISYATSLFQDKRAKEIVLKATGQAISKAVAIAEILKKNMPGLYQDATISSTSITDVWEPIEEGLVPLEMTRHVSMISIYLSTKDLNSNSPGYQAPAYVEQPKRKPQRQYYQQRQQQPQQFKQALVPITENSYASGQGRGRGRNSGGRGGYVGYGSGYGGGDYNNGGGDYNSSGYSGGGGYGGGYSNGEENGGWNHNWNGNGRGRTGSFRGAGYERGRGGGRRGYGGGQGYGNEGARGYEGGGGRWSYEGGGGRWSYEGGGGRGYNRGRGRMAPRGRAY